jgi:hypothetical protein
MIPNDDRPGPASGVMLLCPVNGCPWRHERTKPDLSLVTASPRGFPDLDFSQAFAAAGRADDDACRAHLNEHPVEDFLRTINELRAELATKSADAHEGAPR